MPQPVMENTIRTHSKTAAARRMAGRRLSAGLTSVLPVVCCLFFMGILYRIPFGMERGAIPRECVEKDGFMEYN